MADEINPQRRDSGLRGALSARERLTIAGRIAAASIYGGRSAIWTGIDKGDVPQEDVKVSSLAGSSTMLDGNALPVSEDSVRDALSCGLFSAVGPDRVGWAHQSYSEYLAAWHVVEQNVSRAQITSLLYYNADGRVVPQLYGVAGWLAVLDRRVFERIVRTDPHLILSADVAGLDESLRASTVEGLLAAIHASAVPYSFDWLWYYKKLAHPRLADQLQPYLNDRTKSTRARYEAINIAKMCEAKGVQSELARLALDETEELDLRANAACAVAHYADADVRTRLKPLAEGLAQDRDDELKGCALRALWPSHMSAEELFEVLTPPKRGLGFFGAYRSFMSEQLTNGLKPPDLPAALKWIEHALATGVSGMPLEEIASRVFYLAWTNLDGATNLELFARALRLWLERAAYMGARLDASFVATLRQNDTKRRRLIEAMAPRFSDPSRALMALEFHDPQLVFARDVPWMCERLLAVRDRQTQAVWAKLVSRCIDPGDVDNFGRITEAYRASPTLKAELEHVVEPIELGSDRADALRRAYREEQELLVKRPQERPQIAPAQQRVSACLERFDSGELDAWWHANYELLWDTEGSMPVHESEADLTALPGWKSVTEETRARLIRAARAYVRDADPGTSKWLGTNQVWRPAWAGYRALRLVLSQQPQSLEQISVIAWQKWAPMILAYPTYSEADSVAQGALVKMAYAGAPKEIIDTLAVMIDKENLENRTHLPCLRAMQECWTDDFKNALLEKVRDPSLRPHAMGSILSLLLEHDVPEAGDFARSLFVSPIPGQGVERERAFVVAGSLLIHTGDAGWSTVWPVIRDDAGLGREVVERLMSAGFDMRAWRLAQKLTDSQLGEFYLWLVRQYPYSDDPVHDGAYAVGPREMVAHFRDSVLENLKNRGTWESCEAINKLVETFPNLPWLGQALLEAQRLTRQRTWQPPRVSHIVRLTTDAHARLVETGAQLLEVLIESLERLQGKLLGETPRSRFLWNQTPDGRWRPKEEDSLSDFIKGHFDDDLTARGIVLGREVQIRRRAGDKRGEDTDIHVTAVRKVPVGREYDSLCAIAEVKGCWNRELKTAMKTQLVETYLKNSQCSCGLYVVGWFNCDAWDKSDSRRERAPASTVDEAKQQFDSQASDLSADDRLIRAFVIDIALR